jgi:RimJ/RimL family protein N-acetyltransferase
MPDEVQLRDVITDDLPIFFEHQLEPVATQMAAFPARERDPFMKHWAKILGDNTIIKKTIVFNGQVAGNIVSWEESGEREVGYWIGKEYWGKGIGTKALAEFLHHVRTRPLFAHVAKLNIGSFRVLEKNGFMISSQDTEEYIMKLG